MKKLKNMKLTNGINSCSIDTKLVLRIDSYMINTPIKKNTKLEPADILKSPEGKFYQILSFFADKGSYRLTPYPDDHSDIYNNVQFIILKQALINKGWEKVEQKNLGL